MATVLITGANRGLGLELTRQYAARGWEVIACARRPEAAPDLAALAHASGGRVALERLDVTDHKGVDAAARRLAGRPIDVLFNSAGTMGRGSRVGAGFPASRFGEIDYADWEEIFRVNVEGPMKVTEAFVEHVARSAGRKVVALSSVVGSIASNTSGGLYAYRGSKAALNACMKSLAIDLGRSHGLVVAMLHPGWVRTDMGGPHAARSVAEGADSIVWLATLPDSGPTGGFFQDRRPIAW